MKRIVTGISKRLARTWLILVLLGVILAGAWGCSRPAARGYGADADLFFATVRPVSSDPSRLLRNAHYFQLMGRKDLALKELEEAYALDPKNLKVISALARNYEARGEYARVRQIYAEALNRHPDHQALANNRCFTFYLEGKWTEAEACFKQILEKDPQNVAARNNLGLVYCRLGKDAEAYRLWKDAGDELAAQTMMQQAMAALGRNTHYAGTSPAPASPAATKPAPLQMAASPRGSASPVKAPEIKPESTGSIPVEPASPAAATIANRAEALDGPPPAPKLTAQELIDTRLVVLNGAGIRKLAHRVRSLLSEEGYHVARIGNHIDFGAERTIIYYRPEAQKVAQALSAGHFPQSELASSEKLPRGADVKIVLGKELAALEVMAALQP